MIVSTPTSDDTILHFGRYEGKDVSEVPRLYLCALTQREDIWPETRRVIMRELSIRGLPLGRYKGVPLCQLNTTYLQWLLNHFDLWPPYKELVQDELQRYL